MQNILKQKKNRNMANNYKELIQSPMWQKKRLEVFNQKGFRCEECGDEESQLAVHHKYYKYNLKPWEYEDDAYMVLCTSCHDDVHKAKKIVLTVQEAQIISLIRENLKNDSIIDLHFALSIYSDSMDWGLFENLSYIIRDRILLNFINHHIGQYRENLRLKHFQKSSDSEPSPF